MQRVLPILRFISPVLFTAAALLRSYDADEEGVDDRLATILSYTATVIDAVLKNLPIPPTPAALKG